jgi:membrane associated rhomboid family serine protease
VDHRYQRRDATGFRVQSSRPGVAGFLWTLLTYPLVSVNPISLLFYGLMMWWVGGSLERSWGTRFYAIYFGLMSVITAVGLSAAAFLTNSEFIIDNWLPLAALIVAWCMLNPNEEIRLYGIIPILAKWLALGEVLLIFFIYSNFGERMNLLTGMCALTGCAASFAWVRTRAWHDIHLYSSMPVRQPKIKKKKVRRDDDFSWRDLNPLERVKRARRKKQFQRLFEDDDK